jgi:hypothetical protein
VLSTHPPLFSPSSRQTGFAPAPGFIPPGMHETMLSVHEANTMVNSFQSGIRQAGWLYKLVGKTPQDVNWKKYWVRKRACVKKGGAYVLGRKDRTGCQPTEGFFPLRPQTSSPDLPCSSSSPRTASTTPLTLAQSAPR